MPLNMPKSPIRVLAVDDEADICTLTKRFLEMSEALEVDTVCSVREALAELAKKRYDVIVSDYQMPEEDGIQFLKSLRAADNTVPFILFTGKGREEVVIEALNNGADSYLQKGGKSVPQYAELEHRIRVVVQRHRGEEALRESEKRYCAILNQAADGILIHDKTGQIIDVNRKSCQSLGYTREELLSKNIEDIDPTANQERNSELWKATLAGESYTFESHQVRKDGNSIPVEVTLGSVHLPDGSAILGIVRDITERKQSEEALRESEEKYRTLVLYSGDPIFSFNPDETYRFVNEAFAKPFGKRPEDILGKTPHALFPYDEAEQRLTLVRRVFQSGEKGEIEVKVVTSTGEVTCYLTIVDPIKDEKGKVLFVSCISKNITERKRAEEELRKNEKKYRLITNNIADVVSVMGMDRRFTYVSPSIKGLRGFTAEEAVEQSLDQVFTPESMRIVLSTMSEEMELESSGNADPDRTRLLELEEYRKDGSTIWVSNNISFMHDENGQPMGIIAVSRDITERKQAEEALRDSEVEFRTLFEESPDAVIIIGIDGNVLRCNRAATSMINMSKEEIIGTNFAGLGIFSTKDVDRFQQTMLAQAEGASTPPIVHQIHLRNGKEILAESHSSAVMKGGRFHATQIISRDVTELKETERKLNQLAEQTSLKLEHVLSPDYDIEEEELANILDTQELQSLMESFYTLTSIGIAIIDVKDNIMIAIGWKDICTRFHRVHPETRRNCIESDLLLTHDLRPGEYRAYKCKNGLWDIATPIYIGKKHAGNIFFGQFFYDDEAVDTEFFVAQAEKYDFDKEAYLSALVKVPRWTKDRINQLMDFYSKFATMVSHLSYSNLKLAKTLIDYDRADDAKRQSEEKYRILVDNANVSIVVLQEGMAKLVNPTTVEVIGYSEQELKSKPFHTLIHPDDRVMVTERHQKRLDGEVVPSNYTTRLIRKDGGTVWTEVNAVVIEWEGRPATLNFLTDVTERKLAEEALQASRRALAGIIDFLPDATAVIDSDGKVVAWNQAIEKMTGVSKEEMVGQGDHAYSIPFYGTRRSTLSDLLVLDDEELKKKYDYVTRIGESLYTEAFCSALNEGKGAHVWATATSIYDDQGNRVGAIESIRDITERKRVEEALRESVQRYELVMDGSSAGLWDSDVVNKRIHFSSHWKAMRGYTDAEIGDSEEEWISRIHPDDAPRVMAAMQAHFAGQTEVYEEEYRVLRKDGSFIWVLDRGKAVRDASGKVIRNVGSEIDITERKLAEEALRESENRFEQLADQSGTIPWEIDAHGLYTYVGHMSKAIWGYRPNELVGKMYFYDLVPEVERESIKATVFATFEKKESFVGFENPTQTKDGRVVIVSTNGIPLLNADGTLRGYQGSDTDITERKRAELALRQANIKLGILSTITRHDINNQMMVVNGFIELCKLRENDPDLIKYLGKMSNAAANVLEQIAFTKDYQELGIHAPAWASVGRRINGAFDLLHPPGVVLEDKTDGVEVLTDPMADKVPYNLIDNSMRHGGHVTRIKMSAEQVGVSMLVVYEDDGVGINAEDRKRLFQKGFGKNTGYGLFLIREILAITGITITENGQAGKGVRFEMLVPPGAWRRT
jgi:PAS domain S-box-containing protein